VCSSDKDGTGKLKGVIKMLLGLKIAATLTVVVVSLGVLDRFLHWMNQPSDARLYSGLLGALSLLVFVPALLTAIWNSGKRRM
jgi:hypothetical protein